MSRTSTFLRRWRGWVDALRYALLIAKRTRVRVELVLDLQIGDDTELEYLKLSFPGWSVQQRRDDWVRLVPPAYL